MNEALSALMVAVVGMCQGVSIQSPPHPDAPFIQPFLHSGMSFLEVNERLGCPTRMAPMGRCLEKTPIQCWYKRADWLGGYTTVHAVFGPAGLTTLDTEYVLFNPFCTWPNGSFPKGCTFDFLYFCHGGT